MKLRDSILLTLMGIGSPLLILASMARTEVCRFDPVKSQVVNISARIPIAPLLLLGGIAQGAGVYFLVKSERDKEKAEQEGEKPKLRSASIPVAALPDRQSQPVYFGSAALEYEPVQASVQNPVQNAEPITQRTVQTSRIPEEYRWFRDLLHYPTVLIYGPQGSGKSSLATYLMRTKIKAGHQVTVMDPHKKAGHWNGLRCVGAGMDYEGVDREMNQFIKDVKRDYQRYSEEENCNFPRQTWLCEEFTNWADECKHSGIFFKKCLSDIRKLNRCVVFISHDRTLTTLGGAKGVAGTRDSGMLELELEARIDPETGEAVPAFKGKLKLPKREPVEVAIASWMLDRSHDFTGLVQNGSARDAVRTAEPMRAEPLNHKQEEDSNDSDFEGSAVQKRLEPLGSGLDSDEKVLNRITELKETGMNQAQIILAIWGAKKGGSQAYQQALNEYKRLTHEG